MARPPKPEQLSALISIRNLTAEHGPELGTKMARASFGHISKATWSRWVAQVRTEDAMFADGEPAAPAAAQPVVQATPPQPAEVCAAAPGVIDFHGQLAIMLTDCDLVRAYAAPIDLATGLRKVRNPMMLVAATKLRAAVMALAQRHAEAAWDVEALRRRHEELVAAIGDAIKSVGDNELTAGILRALKGVADRQKAGERYLAAPERLEGGEHDRC